MYLILIKGIIRIETVFINAEVISINGTNYVFKEELEAANTYKKILLSLKRNQHLIDLSETFNSEKILGIRTL